MENLKEKKQITRKKSSPKKRERNPFANTPMISVPRKNPFAKLPFEEDNNLDKMVETINNFNNSRTMSKSYSTENAETRTISSGVSINYSEIFDHFTKILNTTNPNHAFSALKDLFLTEFKWHFTGIGLFHEKSKCIDLKLYSNSGNCYSSKIFLSDENNPIIKCFNTKTCIENDGIDYLVNPYLTKTGSVIFPMISINKCIGVMIAGQNASELNKNFLSLMSNHVGLYIS